MEPSDTGILATLAYEPHLFRSALPGVGYPLATNQLNSLSGQDESSLVWFYTGDLWVRSNRLRTLKEPSKISTIDYPDGKSTGITASIHDIAAQYKKNYLFNSNPILVHFEKIPDKGTLSVVYEGRHRAVGAELAKRPFILGRLISGEHSTVRSQTNPENKKYFQKPFYHLSEFTQLYKNNKEV